MSFNELLEELLKLELEKSKEDIAGKKKDNEIKSEELKQQKLKTWGLRVGLFVVGGILLYQAILAYRGELDDENFNLILKVISWLK